jgi:2-polyprenyl-6-methoxyphenol hydroxylase-like FAD-dependent oxidoreductase
MGNIMIIPADPNVPLPAPRPVTLGTGNVTVSMKRSYWIPRHQMVEILQEECHRHNVTLLHGKQFQSMSANETSVSVSCADGSDYTSSLVVAADGYESSVREYLRQYNGTDWCVAPQWKVRRYKSPATGVKLKALQFPPNFTIPNGTESVVTDSEGIYVVRGTKDGSRTRLGLGFLPVKDPNLVRPANANTRSDHIIWSIQDGPSMKQYFQENFPRFEWDNYVSEEEWERFSQANGTSFPCCQYSTGAAVWSSSGNAGVVLVGDACHAFPPDIGQGINAGLQDIVALDQSLRGEDIDTRVMETSGVSSTPVTPRPLSSALAAYQKNRVAEHRALIRLARFGAPYQYRQPWLRDRIGRFLWSLNVALRMLLSKLLPAVCPPPAVLLTNQRPDLTFRQVMRRADTLTLVLQILLLQVFGLRLGLLKVKWLLYSWISTSALYAASRLVRNTNKAA